MEDWRIFFNVTERGTSGNVIIWGDTSKMDLLPEDFCKSGSLVIDDTTGDAYSYSQSKKTWTMI